MESGHLQGVPLSQEHLQQQQQTVTFIQPGDTSDPRIASAPQQVCSFYMRTGTCAYGTRCKFYHPHPSEVPPPVLNSRGYPVRTQGEPDCAHYLKKGWCAFGMTCKFNHPEIVAGPNVTLATAQPGSVLLASNPANTAVLQGPVVYTSGAAGQTYVQASPLTQPAPTTVYYVPSSQGTLVPSVVQPYSLPDSGLRGAKQGGLVLASTTADGQPLYTTAGPAGARAVYTTPAGSQVYAGGTQFVEQQLMPAPGTQLVPGQPGRRGAGMQQPIMSAALHHSGLTHLAPTGMEGAVTYLQDDTLQPQQLPTSYIQRQQVAGAFTAQQPMGGGAMRPRQQLIADPSAGTQSFMLGSRGADTGSMLQSMYDQGQVQSGAGQGLMLYMDHKAQGAGGRYGAGQTSGVSSGSVLGSGSLHSNSAVSGMLSQTPGGQGGGPGGSGAASGSGGEGLWQGQAGADRPRASQDRLVQQLQSLRLQQQQQQPQTGSFDQ